MTGPARPAARLVWPVMILLAAVLGALFLRDRLGFAALAEHRVTLLAFRDAHYLGALLLFALAYVAIVALSLPGATVATLTGGFLFGVVPGVMVNVLSATAGACLIFLAIRAGLGAGIAARLDRAGGAVGRLKAGLDRNQWSVLLLMRLMPVVPFFVANILPALLNVPAGRFALTTLLGILPAGVVYTALGAGLGDVFDRGEVPDLGIIFSPVVFWPLMGLCLLASLPILARWKGWKWNR